MSKDNDSKPDPQILDDILDGGWQFDTEEEYLADKNNRKEGNKNV